MNVTLRNSRIKLPLGQIFWREVGLGPVLVFLHGTWQEGSQWLPIIENLREDYHCFAPDLLGFGDSEKPKIHYSIQLEVECLRQYLDALHIPQVYLIGHSLGAWIAASYALQDTERVRGVVLLAPEGVEVEKQQKNLPWIRWLVGRPPIAYSILKAILPMARLFGGHKAIAQALQQRQQLLNSPTACQLLLQRRNGEIQAELLQERLTELTVPMLIIQGRQDSGDAIARSKLYGKNAPKSQLIFLEEAGDNLYDEFREVVAKHINDFVSSQEF